MRDAELLRRLSDMRWTPPPWSAEFEVCISGDREYVDVGELTLKLGIALERLVEALGLAMPKLGVRTDATLAAGTFEVRALGRTRLCGAFGVAAGQWWRAHRCAGPCGRTGVVATPPDLDAPLKPVDLLVRAAEEVAWSDPGDLDALSDQRVRELLPATVDVADDDLPLWRDALRGLLRARVPLAGLHHLFPDDDASRVEPSAPVLADGLERPPSRLRLGADVFAALRRADDESLELDRMIAEVVEELWTMLGVACTPAPEPVLDQQLAGWGFALELGGLVRAAGEVPETPAQWIHPVSGLRVDAPPRDDVEGVESILAAQVSACLQEAAAEFVELAWVEESLDQHAERLAELVEIVRDRIPTDCLTEVLARIAGERRTLRGPAIMERLLEAGEQPAIELVLDEAEQDAALAWSEDQLDVSGLVELARTVVPLARPPAWTVALEADAIARLRADHNGEAEAHVLRMLDATATGHPDGDGVLLVPLDLRPAVSRLVRAQLPALAVVTPHEAVEGQLDDECPG